jgi:hypothetical protein
VIERGKRTEASPAIGAEREAGQAVAAEGAGRVVAAAVAADTLLRALVHVHARATLRRRPIPRLAHALERSFCVHATPALRRSNTRINTIMNLIQSQHLTYRRLIAVYLRWGCC